MDQIIADAYDANSADDLLVIHNQTFYFGEVKFSFLDIFILHSIVSKKELQQDYVDYLLSIGVSSDFVSEDQNLVAELAKLNLQAEEGFQETIKTLLLKIEIKDRHDFDNLKNQIIQKSFVPNEKDFQLMTELREFIHQTYDHKENPLKDGEPKFNQRIRNCLDVIYDLFEKKLPDEIRQRGTTSSVFSPSSASNFAPQPQVNYLE